LGSRLNIIVATESIFRIIDGFDSGEPGVVGAVSFGNAGYVILIQGIDIDYAC
jgi:hypothetical protein